MGHRVKPGDDELWVDLGANSLRDNAKFPGIRVDSNNLQAYLSNMHQAHTMGPRMGPRELEPQEPAMTDQNFAIFDTAIGRCGIAWGPRGINAVQLPMGNEDKTRARIRQRYGDIAEAPPSVEVQAAIAGIVELLAGKPNDLADVVLDLDGVPEFHRGVYDIARTIPPGKTMTYGDIAKRLGGVELSRDVGQALGRNPCPIVVPCHRVLAAGGKPGGFSANGGVVTKLKMLAIEGAVVNHTPSLFD
jgi:methylated-DNA-[protein]-cysteine S-methyltransferase